MVFSAPSMTVAIFSAMVVARVVALEEAIVDASSELDARRLKAVLPSLNDTTGVRIQQDKAVITFGKNDDIRFWRDKDGNLKVSASKIDFVSGSVTINGKPIGAGGGDSEGGKVTQAMVNLAVKKALAEGACPCGSGGGKSDAKSFKALEPKGYCSDWRYPNTGTQDGGYDDKSKTAEECMKRCMAKLPGTTSFYLMGTQCGCSATKTGKCKITAHKSYVSYEIVNAVGGKEAPKWKHVISAGCKGVLTTGKFGKKDAFCWKGYTDDEINGFMHNSEMKIVFSEGSAKEVTIYTQFAHYPDGELKPWATDPKNNGAKWRNSESEGWRGPCSHMGQLTRGFWFHMKTSSRTDGCAKGNYENTVDENGFENRDGAKFWPLTGWGHIKLYAKLKPPAPRDDALMISLMGDMVKGSDGKYIWKDQSGNGNDCLQVGTITPLKGGGMAVRSATKKKDGCRIAPHSTNNVDTMKTWEFTLKLYSYGGANNGRWFEVANSPKCDTGFNFCPGSSNGELRLWNSKAGTVMSPKNTLKIGEWVHMVIVRNGNKLIMYKNGARIAELSTPGPFEIPGFDRTIMYSDCWDRWNRVDLRSLRIWDDQKDPGTITQLYNDMKPKMADPGPEWRHVIQAGCKGVLTTGKFGSVGSSCWKGYTDDEINSMMKDSQMKITWNKEKVTVYFQFAHFPDGKLRPWATDPKNNGAKWKNEGESKWRGPCSHMGQLTRGFWFHMKTSSRTAGCASGNYENTVDQAGFENRDGATFWPANGWGDISMFVLV